MPADIGDAALARVRSIETLQDAYDAWLELKLEHAQARSSRVAERRRLDQEGEFLVGAVRAASELPSGPGASGSGLLPPDAAGAELFLKEAEQKMEDARRRLEDDERHAESGYAKAFAEIRSQLRQRIERFLTVVKPRVTLTRRSVGADRAILHMSRVKDDEPVLLFYLLNRRIPSRYGFLGDDSTEDVSLAPAPLYGEEGVAENQIRPSPLELKNHIVAAEEVLPVRGFIPLRLPRSDGREDFFRMLSRGPVMEVELLDGDTFRNILSRDEAERFAGYWLRLKLEGRVNLTLEA